MISVKYLSKTSSVINDETISKSVIRRGSVIRPLKTNVEFLANSSFLGKRYENLFLYSHETNDQSLVLEAGDYIVQCDSGEIEIVFYSVVIAKKPYHLSLSEETEVFFLFSDECRKPSIYKEAFVFPFTETVSLPNFLQFSFEELSKRLLKQESRLVWRNRYRNYIEELDISKEIDYSSSDFIGAASVKLDFNTMYGWFFSCNYVDDNQETLFDDYSALGHFRSFDKPSVLMTYYKDESNYASLAILPDYSGVFVCKNNGTETIASLCCLTFGEDTPIMLFTRNAIAIGFSNKQYLFEFDSLFDYDTLFIGYDGMTEYMNNKILGVLL